MAAMLPLLALVAAAFALPPALAAGSGAEERAQIAAGRRAAEASYKAAEEACRQRFVVTPCIDAARAERRRTLTALREREIQLDEVERRQRAALRQEAVARKKAEAASAAAASASAPAAAASRPRLLPPGRAHEGASAPAARAPLDATPAEAAERAARATRRQQEARARRARIEARQAERAVRRQDPSKSAPLPPAAASAGR